MEVDTVTKLSNGNQILRLPFKEFENAYVIMSFKGQTIDRQHVSLFYKQEKYYPVKPFVTFCYAGENCLAEWEPEFGPIMVYYKCEQNWKGENCFGKKVKAKEHWFFDWVKDEPLAFSQMAVTDNYLQQRLVDGDFEGIFRVLKDWAENK